MVSKLSKTMIAIFSLWTFVEFFFVPRVLKFHDNVSLCLSIFIHHAGCFQRGISCPSALGNVLELFCCVFPSYLFCLLFLEFIIWLWDPLDWHFSFLIFSFLFLIFFKEEMLYSNPLIELLLFLVSYF